MKCESEDDHEKCTRTQGNNKERQKRQSQGVMDSEHIRKIDKDKEGQRKKGTE